MPTASTINALINFVRAKQLSSGTNETSKIVITEINWKHEILCSGLNYTKLNNVFLRRRKCSWGNV